MSLLQSWQMTLAWDGGPFHGWQRQPHGQTIQQRVEEALSVVLAGERVAVTATGRTDAGVHALAQIASFAARTPRTPRAIVHGLNVHLPEQIACLDAAHAPAGFDARRWAQRKLYRYRILARPVRCPHRRRQVWWVRRPLDVAAMEAALPVLEGRHDFTSFQASGCTATQPVRVLESATLRQEGDELHLEFIGNGFLRYQVRNMVGTLVAMGLGRFPGAMEEILAAADRRAAGPTAPPHGLWLVWVELGDGPSREER